MPDNDFSGSVRRNKKKEKPNQPDATGSCRIAGVDYWISGWTKKGADGDFLSMSFREKDAAAYPLPPKEQPEDGLPF